MVWFPKLYENRDWDNSLTEDGLTITMTPKTDWAYNRLDGDDDDASNGVGMIVFAHSKDALGSTLYRFMGTFRRSEFREQDCTWIFKRESGRVDLPA